MAYVFKLSSAGPPWISSLAFPQFGKGPRRPRYRLIEDEETAASLQESRGPSGPYFRWLSPDVLEDALGSAEDAVEAIENGEYDDVLDLLQFAEIEAYGARKTVTGAIEARSDELRAERGDDEEEPAANPEDVATSPHPARGA